MKIKRTIAAILLLLASSACDNKNEQQLPGEEEPISGGGGGGGGGVSSRTISAAPANLRLTDATPNSLTLRWDDVAVNELIYGIEYCPGVDCTDFIASPRSPLAENSVSVVETGLAVASQYRFRIRSINRNGNSDWVTSGNLSTLLLPTSNLVAVPTSNSVALSWTSSASPHSTIEIERCTGAGCTSFQKIFSSPFLSPTTSHEEFGLSPATVYRFQVRATGSSASSAWLISEDITTENAPSGPNPPAIPTGLALSNLTDTAVGYSWVDNANN